ncbi:MAG: GNAT family N-acetyltransferase, partial [Thermoanaerobaculia bacterium]
GFRETRGLQCWLWSAVTPVTAFTSSAKAVTGVTAVQNFVLEPSWQNSTASIQRAKDHHVTLGTDDAYAIVFPNTGDLPQLWVHPDQRRQGLGTQLLHDAYAIAQKPLRIMNIDDRHEGIARFLERAGATKLVRQLELLRPL